MSALLAIFILLQNGAFDYDEARPIDNNITW